MGLISKVFDSQKGILTGFPSLDNITGGFKGGGLYILAAATGMGKSLLLLNILVNLAKKGHRSLYFDLENGAPLTAQRALMMWYGLDGEYFKDKKNIPDAETRYEAISEWIDIYDHENLYEIADMAGLNLLDAVRNLIRGSDVEIIAIDPLQAFEIGVSEHQVLRVQTDATRQLKELAQSLNKPIVICHHVRKSSNSGGSWLEDIEDAAVVKYRLPSIDELKGSSGITQYATDVWAMVRTAAHKEKEGRGKTYLRILKARKGAQGDTRDLWLDEDTLQYKDRTSQLEIEEIVHRFGGPLLP